MSKFRFEYNKGERFSVRPLLLPKNGLANSEDSYVKIGIGRDYADVAPVSGTYKGTTNRTLSVDVRIEQRN